MDQSRQEKVSLHEQQLFLLLRPPEALVLHQPWRYTSLVGKWRLEVTTEIAPNLSISLRVAN